MCKYNRTSNFYLVFNCYDRICSIICSSFGENNWFSRWMTFQPKNKTIAFSFRNFFLNWFSIVVSQQWFPTKNILTCWKKVLRTLTWRRLKTTFMLEKCSSRMRIFWSSWTLGQRGRFVHSRRYIVICLNSMMIITLFINPYSHENTSYVSVVLSNKLLIRSSNNKLSLAWDSVKFDFLLEFAWTMSTVIVWK